jgi:hypothetical protein
VGRATAQAVSGRLLTEEARVRAQRIPLGSVVDEVVLEQVSLRVLRLSPVSIIPPLLHIHSCIIWGMDNGPVSGPVPHGRSLTLSQRKGLIG